jgi:hypothetical protein
MKCKNMEKKRCKHANLGHTEVIEAFHETMIDEDGSLMTNLGVGNKLRDEVACYDCGKYWTVTKSSPKFIRKYHLEIERLRDKR